MTKNAGRSFMGPLFEAHTAPHDGGGKTKRKPAPLPSRKGFIWILRGPARIVSASHETSLMFLVLAACAADPPPAPTLARAPAPTLTRPTPRAGPDTSARSSRGARGARGREDHLLHRHARAIVQPGLRRERDTAALGDCAEPVRRRARQKCRGRRLAKTAKRSASRAKIGASPAIAGRREPSASVKRQPRSQKNYGCKKKDLFSKRAKTCWVAWETPSANRKGPAERYARRRRAATRRSSRIAQWNGCMQWKR